MNIDNSTTFNLFIVLIVSIAKASDACELVDSESMCDYRNRDKIIFVTFQKILSPFSLAGGTGLDASDLSYKLSADGDFFITSSCKILIQS